MTRYPKRVWGESCHVDRNELLRIIWRNLDKISNSYHQEEDKIFTFSRQENEKLKNKILYEPILKQGTTSNLKFMKQAFSSIQEKDEEDEREDQAYQEWTKWKERDRKRVENETNRQKEAENQTK